MALRLKSAELHPVFHPVFPGLSLGSSCAKHCCSHIDGLMVRVGGRTLLDNISLHLHCGEVLAIAGPNGGGKSTLLKALIGEIPYSGKVEFLDVNGAVHAKPRIGYVPQSPRFEKGFPITVLDLFAASLSKFPVWFGVRAGMRQRVSELLRRVEAEQLLDRKVGALSGGELQRVLLALALEPQPNLLFLDEPVSGMDANGRRLFYEVVDRLRKTMDLSIILVTHDFQEIASVADRMVLLNGAVLCSGKPADVFAHPSFHTVFGAGVVG